jgi:UDP-3-O-[3-hydroxymyristoyl] glucosamine N-acyltransferase
MFLSEITGSQKYKIERDGLFNITMFPTSVIPQSMCYALNKKTIDIINANSNISAVIILPELIPFLNSTKGIITSDQPAKLYYEFHNKLVKENFFQLVSEKYISPSAKIASSAIIGENVFIDNNVEISHNVQIDNNTIISADTFIGPNVIIGTKGMQNLKVDGKRINILYAGGVQIGQRCEVLANAIIQKPYQAFFTEIGDDTQVSVKVSIGHGSKIGSNCMIAGNSTIAGNVYMGNNVWMGPSSTIGDGLYIGNNAKIMIGSIVAKNITDNEVVSGNFAMNHAKQLKNYAQIRKL